MRFDFSPKLLIEKSVKFTEVSFKIPRVADKVMILSNSEAHGMSKLNQVFKRTGLISLIFNKSVMMIDTAKLPNSSGALITSVDMKIIYGIVLPCTSNQSFEFGILFSSIYNDIHEMNRIPDIHSVFDGVVKVYAKMLGSGVVIGNNLIVTNSHVAYGSKYIDIHQKTTKFKGKLRYASVFIDLAFIEISENLIPVRKANYFVYGETVYALGFGLFNPSDLEYPLITIGSISKVVYYKNKPVAIHFNAQSFNGHSGGGVFNVNGELIGIIVSNAKEKEGKIIPTLNLCIPHTLFNDEVLLNNKDPLLAEIFNYETVRILPDAKL